VLFFHLQYDGLKMGGMLRQRLSWGFLFLTLGLPAWGAEIRELVPVIRQDKIIVSFRMTEAFSEEVERSVASGLPVTFRYTVELKRVRTVWLNQKVTTRHIHTTVTYDNLTERYKLSREIDGEIDATDVVSDVEAMRRFMVTVESVELFDTSLLEPNGEYYLRVKGIVRDRNLFLFIPWDVGSGWEKQYFTYLP
jgi:hypothetical protein